MKMPIPLKPAPPIPTVGKVDIRLRPKIVYLILFLVKYVFGLLWGFLSGCPFTKFDAELLKRRTRAVALTKKKLPLVPDLLLESMHQSLENQAQDVIKMNAEKIVNSYSWFGNFAQLSGECMYLQRRGLEIAKLPGGEGGVALESHAATLFQWLRGETVSGPIIPFKRFELAQRALDIPRMKTASLSQWLVYLKLSEGSENILKALMIHLKIILDKSGAESVDVVKAVQPYILREHTRSYFSAKAQTIVAQILKGTEVPESQSPDTIPFQETGRKHIVVKYGAGIEQVYRTISFGSKETYDSIRQTVIAACPPRFLGQWATSSYSIPEERVSLIDAMGEVATISPDMPAGIYTFSLAGCYVPTAQKSSTGMTLGAAAIVVLVIGLLIHPIGVLWSVFGLFGAPDISTYLPSLTAIGHYIHQYTAGLLSKNTVVLSFVLLPPLIWFHLAFWRIVFQITSMILFALENAILQYSRLVWAKLASKIGAILGNAKKEKKN